MAVDFDFSDFKEALNEFKAEVKGEMAEAGEKAVQYAKEHGDYQDHTGTLRKSNRYEVQDDGLLLKNDTEYASYVEAKRDVLGNAALEGERLLKEVFE